MPVVLGEGEGWHHIRWDVWLQLSLPSDGGFPVDSKLVCRGHYKLTLDQWSRNTLLPLRGYFIKGFTC